MQSKGFSFTKLSIFSSTQAREGEKIFKSIIK